MKKIILASILLAAPLSFGFTLKVSGLKAGNQGVYRCLVFNSADGFPGTPSKALQSVNGTLANGAGECVFMNLPAGTYAISSFQDENSNGKIDKNLLGMPTEKYGFSNDASKPFGPPEFSAASFQLSQDTIIKINLK